MGARALLCCWGCWGLLGRQRIKIIIINKFWLRGARRHELGGVTHRLADAYPSRVGVRLGVVVGRPPSLERRLWALAWRGGQVVREHHFLFFYLFLIFIGSVHIGSGRWVDVRR